MRSFVYLAFALVASTIASPYKRSCDTDDSDSEPTRSLTNTLDSVPSSTTDTSDPLPSSTNNSTLKPPSGNNSTLTPPFGNNSTLTPPSNNNSTTTPASNNPESADGPVGYASLNGGTTGGAGGSTTTVTSLADLVAAVAGDEKKIVMVSGIIAAEGEAVKVGSNTTILGVGPESGLTGGGFSVKKAGNVIFQNLKMSLSPAPVDLIGLSFATNVWIDHCEFFNDLDHGKDFYDGATDITHASDFITVSWNKYHDTFKTSLVGHSDSNGDEDTGHLRVTYHHNSFINIGSRVPSLRFGTGHFYNNVIRNAITSGVNSRLGAQILVENNIFDKVADPIETKLKGGFVNAKANVFIGGSEVGPIDAGTLNTVPYTYELDDASSFEALVLSSAGTGVVGA